MYTVFKYPLHQGVCKDAILVVGLALFLLVWPKSAWETVEVWHQLEVSHCTALALIRLFHFGAELIEPFVLVVLIDGLSYFLRSFLVLLRIPHVVYDQLPHVLFYPGFRLLFTHIVLNRKQTLPLNQFYILLTFSVVHKKVWLLNF